MKLPATTIVESMMALVVIVISFTAAMTVYLTVLQGDAFPLRTKANAVLHCIWVETQQEERFLDETIEREGLLIEKTVVPYTIQQEQLLYQAVYCVSLKAFSPDARLVGEERHLIHLDHEH